MKKLTARSAGEGGAAGGRIQDRWQRDADDEGNERHRRESGAGSGAGTRSGNVERVGRAMNHSRASRTLSANELLGP